MIEKQKDVLWAEECQPLTTEQMTNIKSQFHPSNTANVNIVPYHIYDEDEHVVGEWREIVDGVKKKKPAYEKTIVLKRNGTDKYTYSSNIYNNCLPSNIDVICSSKLNAKRGAGEYEVYVDVYNNGAYVTFVPNPTTMNIFFQSTYTTTDLIYTLEYTKTTDQWQTI